MLPTASATLRGQLPGLDANRAITRVMSNARSSGIQVHRISASVTGRGGVDCSFEMSGIIGAIERLAGTSLLIEWDS